MLQLDNYRVPGKQMLVKGSMELRGEDIAGETSSTERVEKGIKPKVLTVAVQIPFVDKDDLRSLMTVAEAKTGDGEQKIYTITNRTANAAGIRQVRFMDHVRWNESDDGLQAWKVQFSLQEYMSNPERVEQRQSNETSSATTQFETVLAKAEKLNL